jgi:hypothetical protein
MPTGRDRGGEERGEKNYRDIPGMRTGIEDYGYAA